MSDLAKKINQLTKHNTMSSIVMRLGEWAYGYAEYLDSIGESGSKHRKSAKALFSCANRMYNIWR